MLLSSFYLRTASAFIIFAMSIVLVACSTKQDDLSKIGVLRTHIRPDGTKLFVFISQPHSSRVTGRTNARNGSQANRVSNRQRSRGRANTSIREYLHIALEEKLAQSGYCREGYLPLGQYIEFGQFELRGECQESATEQDRVKFSNHASYHTETF